MSTASLPKTRVAALSSPEARPHGLTCRRCKRPMVRRVDDNPTGAPVLCARTLCRTCHSWAKRNGRLGDYPTGYRKQRVELPPGRRHGTYSAYRGCGCGCEPCRLAGSRYEKRRAALGTNHLTDAEPVRAHVRALRNAGLGLYRISDLTGVPRQTLTELFTGRPSKGRPPPRRIKRETAQRLLALDPRNAALADGTPVDATGARRALQAMVRNGWSYVRQQQITAVRARALAVRNRWAPAMAWDDETIHTPDAEPQGINVDHAPRIGLPPADDLLWLADFESVTEIARRFGVRESSVKTAIGRAREKAA